MSSTISSNIARILIFLVTCSTCFNLKKINQHILKTVATPKQNCTCVPYFQCSDDTGELIVDGHGLLDFRKFDTTCTGYFDVCCNITKENIFETTTSSSDTEKPQGCGYKNSGITPWSGVLLYQKGLTTPGLYKCGFSLIHRRVGLTAAHCLDNEDGHQGRFSVKIGNTVSFVSQITIHPHFNPSTLQNDIALVFLSTPIPHTRNTVCISPPRTLLDNTTCFITYRDNKNIITLPVVPRDSCLKALRQTRLGPFFQLHRSFLCAGDGEEDTCDGDGGSALVCPIPGQMGRFHQVGIVSWGIGCADGIPGVYVNVGMFREWIDRQMISNGLDITSYRY